MALSKTHYSNKIIKHPTKKIGGKVVDNPDWKRVHTIVGEAYADAANGKLKSEIMTKLVSGLYPSQEGKGMCERMAEDYYAAVKGRIKEDFDEKQEVLKERLLLSYYNVYDDAIENGDRMNAIKALDGLAKILGMDKPQSTNIQINGTEQGGVQVNFGFIKDDN